MKNNPVYNFVPLEIHKALQRELDALKSAYQQALTEQKRSGEELQSSKHVMERIISNVPVGVFWKDKNLIYLGCNSLFARNAGYSTPEEIIGQDDYQLIL